MQLIAPMFDGPIDIVGDVHGEFNALMQLLRHLGYDGSGRHRDGRRLVFVGDLVDRGPDSPAVLELVMELVRAGHAQCVLGNHELNLLRNDDKDGNSWYTNPDKKPEYPARRATPSLKRRARAFLTSLPLALERNDLRVIHANWNRKALAAIRRPEVSELSALKIYRKAQRELKDHWESQKYKRRLAIELDGHLLKDRGHKPPFMPLLAKKTTDEQMMNAVAVLTSGEEEPANAPFWAGGKWRMVRRVPWWDHYHNKKPVIIGHYWRQFARTSAKFVDKDGPDLFKGIRPHHWFGARGNVYCVDFSVGARHRERFERVPPYVCKLAALRVPEWRIVSDDGKSFSIGPPR